MTYIITSLCLRDGGCMDVCVVLETTRQLEAGEVIDLTPDIEENYKFFAEGPGYAAQED